MTEPLTRYWSWLRAKLGLTGGGRIVFTAFLALGLVAVLTGTGFAFYNVESGHDPDQILGFQIVFTLVAAGIPTAVLLGLVTGIDFVFRAGRRCLVR